MPREKQVTLTFKGEKFLRHMIAEGRNSIRKLVAHFAVDEVDGGIRFLRKVTARSSYGRQALSRPNGKTPKSPVSIKYLEPSQAVD